MTNSTKTTKTAQNTASAKTTKSVKLSFTASTNKKINSIRNSDNFAIAYIFNRTKTRVIYLHYCVADSVVDAISKYADSVTINKNFDAQNVEVDAYKYDIRVSIASYDTVIKKLIALLNADAQTAKYIDTLNASKKHTVDSVHKTEAQRKADAQTRADAKQTASAQRTAQKRTASKKQTAKKQTDSADSKTDTTASTAKRTHSAEAQTVA